MSKFNTGPTASIYPRLTRDQAENGFHGTLPPWLVEGAEVTRPHRLGKGLVKGKVLKFVNMGTLGPGVAIRWHSASITRVNVSRIQNFGRWSKDNQVMPVLVKAAEEVAKALPLPQAEDHFKRDILTVTVAINRNLETVRDLLGQLLAEWKSNPKAPQ